MALGHPPILTPSTCQVLKSEASASLRKSSGGGTLTSQVGAAAATGHHTSWLPASPIITTECLAACMRAAHHGEAVPEVAAMTPFMAGWCVQHWV